MSRPLEGHPETCRRNARDHCRTGEGTPCCHCGSLFDHYTVDPWKCRGPCVQDRDVPAFSRKGHGGTPWSCHCSIPGTNSTGQAEHVGREPTTIANLRDHTGRVDRHAAPPQTSTGCGRDYHDGVGKIRSVQLQYPAISRRIRLLDAVHVCHGGLPDQCYHSKGRI